MLLLASRRILSTALLVVGVASVVAVVAVWLWLPWNPLEGRVEHVHELLPDGMRLVVRFDADRAAKSPLARRLWEHASVRRARQRFDLDRTVVEPVQRVEARLADATLGLGEAPTVRRDFFGSEVLVGLRGDDVLVLTRISSRARAIEAVRRLDGVELERLGLRLDGDLVLVEGDGRPPLTLARHRDVLAIGTSRALVEEVLDRSRGRGTVAAGARGLAAAVRAAPAAVATFWGDPASRPGAAAEPSSAEEFWQAVFDPSRLRPLTGSVELEDRDGLRVRVNGAYREVPRALEDLGGGAGRFDPRVSAARFAIPEEAIVVAGFRVPAARAVELFVDAQPPSRRDLVNELLAETGDTAATVAARLAAKLGHGVGAVVARLPDADEIDLDSPAGGAVDPIPATVLVFRLREGASGKQFLADLRRECDTLFGSPLRAEPERIGGASLHTLEKNVFGGYLSLLRPAFALVDDFVVFSTNARYLRRALRLAPAGARAGVPYAARADVAGGPLRDYLDDQRWEHAERASFHDWRREREQIRQEMNLAAVARTPAERAEHEERVIAERVRRREEVEFPRALEEYRRAWEPLRILSAARLSATFDGTDFRVEAQLDVEADGEPDGAPASAPR